MDWDLVIFDCDGVLVNSEPIGNRLIAEALTEAGLPMSSDGALHEFLGGKLTVRQSSPTGETLTMYLPLESISSSIFQSSKE